MIPQFDNSKDRLAWLRINKDVVRYAKKNTVKIADSCRINIPMFTQSADVKKELGEISMPAVNGILQLKAVINTTNLFDSHGDVHLPGIWKKSLQETQSFYLLQEHKAQFDKVISSDMKAYTKSLTWKSLGQDYEGSTQALIFDGAIEEKRNPFMYDQYANKYVDNHSVGMRYMKLFMCVNSEEKWWIEEKEAWEKYFGDIVNPEDADEYGMFWAVTEAKVNEGSPVVFGSNFATPTLEVKSAGASTDSIIEPDASTQQRKSKFAMIGGKL